jgi:hypothetical protein
MRFKLSFIALARRSNSIVWGEPNPRSVGNVALSIARYDDLTVTAAQQDGRLLPGENRSGARE